MIDGYGNGDLPIAFGASDAQLTIFPIPRFSDKVIQLRCMGSITDGIEKSKAVLRNGIYMANFGGTSPYRFVGIAPEDIQANAYGYVLQHGYYQASALGLDNLARGTLLTVSDGSLVPASDTDKVVGYIERIWQTLFLYLY